MSEAFSFYKNTLGHYLREARRRLGLTLRELEERSGVSDTQIRRLEMGDFNCALDTYVRLCAALGLPFGEMLERMAAPSSQWFLKSFQDDPDVGRLFAEAGLGTQWQKDIGYCLFSAIAMMLVHAAFSSDPVRRVSETQFPDAEIKQRLVALAGRLSVNVRADARLHLLVMLNQVGLRALENLGVATRDEFKALLQRHADRRGMSSDFFGSDPDDYPAWLPTDVGESGVLSPFDPRALGNSEKSKVDKNQLYADKPDVRHTWKSLKTRLAKATAVHGKKTEVAKFVGVDKSNLNRWLDDDQEPGAEAAFRLLEWVTAEEAKTKSSGGAITLPEPKTRTAKKHSYETKQSEPRKGSQKAASKSIRTRHR